MRLINEYILAKSVCERFKEYYSLDCERPYSWVPNKTWELQLQQAISLEAYGPLITPKNVREILGKEEGNKFLKIPECSNCKSVFDEVIELNDTSISEYYLCRGCLIECLKTMDT